MIRTTPPGSNGRITDPAVCPCGSPRSGPLRREPLPLPGASASGLQLPRGRARGTASPSMLS
ncbi:hypothetical protein ACFFX0_22270 [Citricoccus parietis]|uniref:Uncharacterized protein n=1 Tax=Citricoccus parietis TaxID=592307 RepID=A0ABV5G4E7_9MICC